MPVGEQYTPRTPPDDLNNPKDVIPLSVLLVLLVSGLAVAQLL